MGIQCHQAGSGPGGIRRGVGVRAYLGDVDGLSGAGVGQPQVGDGAVDAGLPEGVGGREQGLAGLQRRQVFKPFLPGELGMAHVHHHHARQEPQEEQQAHADAQPAVAKQDPAFDVG